MVPARVTLEMGALAGGQGGTGDAIEAHRVRAAVGLRRGPGDAAAHDISRDGSPTRSGQTVFRLDAIGAAFDRAPGERDVVSRKGRSAERPADIRSAEEIGCYCFRKRRDTAPARRAIMGAAVFVRESGRAVAADTDKVGVGAVREFGRGQYHDA